MKDEESYIGNLLIKNNLVSPEKVNQLLQKQNGNLLGQKLINDCNVSPHILQKILKEQLTTRLLKTMNNQMATIKIEEGAVSSSGNILVSLGIKNLLDLIDSWMKSKVNPQWIKNFFQSKSQLFVKNYPFLYD